MGPFTGVGIRLTDVWALVLPVGFTSLIIRAKGAPKRQLGAHFYLSTIETPLVLFTEPATAASVSPRTGAGMVLPSSGHIGSISTRARCRGQYQYRRTSDGKSSRSVKKPNGFSLTSGTATCARWLRV